MTLGAGGQWERGGEDCAETCVVWKGRASLSRVSFLEEEGFRGSTVTKTQGVNGPCSCPALCFLVMPSAASSPSLPGERGSWPREVIKQVSGDQAA